MRALSLHKFLDVKSLRLITSEGPCLFSKGKCGEGSRRGARPLLVGGVALLLLAHNLVLLVVPALSENLSLSEETPRQLFLHLFFFFFLLCLTQNRKHCLEVLSDRKTRVSDM